MDRVEEIERAIDGLPQEEFQRVALWVRERAQQRWDENLDRDSLSVRLDFLFDEAGGVQRGRSPRLAAG